MGISSLLGGLLGRNAKTNYDTLSAADIAARIAPKEARAKEIRMLLQRAEGSSVTEEKSRQWMQKMEKSAEEARSDGDAALLAKIKAEMAEAQERTIKIEKGARKINEELLGLEEEIELLTRALDKKQKQQNS